MKAIQLEKIGFEAGKSFKLFSPRLRNTFLWHYHPEFELVYVEADAGMRHVGSHISGYVQDDLVLIGANLPHLNFDYRLRSDYHQIVVQLKTDFMGTALQVSPEYALIRQLFDEARFGISFYGETKTQVAERLKQMPGLDHFAQLTELMQIFQLLALSQEKVRLNSEEPALPFFLKDKIRMGAIYEYIDARYHVRPDVNEIAANVNMSTASFCRYFKRQTHMTFSDFMNRYRMDVAKNLLLQGKSVSEVC